MKHSPEKNNTQLALDILRGLWLMKDADALAPVAQAFLQRGDVKMENSPASIRLYTATQEDVSENPDSHVEKKVFILPLHGAMTKYDTCSSYGTQDLAATLLKYAAREDVIGIILDIDSPGGNVNAIMPLVQAINKVKESKPVIAHCDQCASAALWVASQCDSIFLDNEMSQIGSLGAYASIYDNRENIATGEKIITVYADESGDKNAAVRDALEGKYEKIKAELSEIVSKFQASVVSGRPDLKQDAEGVMTGAMFYPEKAIEVGLADGMSTLDQCIENVFIRAEI